MMLNIEDLSKFKILEITQDLIEDYMIFTYDDKMFLLSSKFEKITLYNIDNDYPKWEKICEVSYLNNSLGSFNDMRNMSNQEIIWKLTWNDIVDSFYTEEIEKRKYEIEHIENLERKLREIKCKLRKFPDCKR